MYTHIQPQHRLVAKTMVKFVAGWLDPIAQVSRASSGSFIHPYISSKVILFIIVTKISDHFIYLFLLLRG